MAGCRLTFVILFLFCILQIGKCLQCYSCTGTICKDPVDTSAINKVYCNERNYGCMKQKLPGRDVDRGCTAVAFCEVLNSKSEHCSVCTTELCNSSSLAVPSTTFLTLSLVIAYFLCKS